MDLPEHLNRQPGLPEGAGEALAEALAAGPSPQLPLLVQLVAEPADAPEVAVWTWYGHPAWWVVGTIERIGGALVIGSLRITARDPNAKPAGGVTSAVLRAIPVGQVLAGVQAMILQAPLLDEARAKFGVTQYPPSEQTAHRRAAEGVAEQPPRWGKRGYGDEHYRQVALDYLDLYAKGTRRGLLVALGERWSERLGRPVASATARDWVRIARERGFLGPGKQGRAGAEPGPNLDPQKGAL